MPDLSQLVRNTAPFREVVAVLAKYGFADWLADADVDWLRALVKDSQIRDLENVSREARIRQAMTELGTTFIILGL